MKQLSLQIQRLIDALYLPLFRRVFDLKTFRYAFVGGINLAFGIVLYWVLFNFVLQKEDTNIFGVVTISAPILAFLINFIVTLLSGFWLTRTVAFEDSSLKGRVQLLRYCIVVAVNLAINYFGLKLLVEVMELYPTPSYLALQILTVVVSYLASRYYTFK